MNNLLSNGYIRPLFYASFQEPENNNWIILYPLGNIYEIYTNLTDDPFKLEPL